MATPTYMSPVPDDVDLSAAVIGSARQGLPLFEQGLNVARVLEAKKDDGTPLYPEAAVMLPRRGQKTTSIWATLLGRCETNPNFKVVTTAQTGLVARGRWYEVMRALRAGGFEDRGGKIREANGHESFEWSNGSRLWVVPPRAAAFRSEAADTIFFDESGELSPDESEDLMSGALPLMDTRPQGQVIIAGTPAKVRAGLLWESLQTGRAGKTGIVDYSIRDDEPSVFYDEDGTPILNLEVLRRVHPGIGTLTTEAKIIERFEKMQLPQFEMEYFCRFPLDNTTGAIRLDKWAASRVDPVSRPDRVGIAFDCAYDGSSASIVYAWRDESGRAYIEVAAHRPGTSWLPQATHHAGSKYRGSHIGHDDIGANRDPAEALRKLRPAVKLLRYQMKDIMGAAQRLVSEIHSDNLSHFGQTDLDQAVENVSWRTIQNSGRAFGNKAQNGSAISPVVAASLALWTFDKQPKRVPLGIVA
jgi:phage terminase large subunit-like protein